MHILTVNPNDMGDLSGYLKHGVIHPVGAKPLTTKELQEKGWHPALASFDRVADINKAFAGYFKPEGTIKKDKAYRFAKWLLKHTKLSLPEIHYKGSGLNFIKKQSKQAKQARAQQLFYFTYAMPRLYELLAMKKIKASDMDINLGLVVKDKKTDTYIINKNSVYYQAYLASGKNENIEKVWAKFINDSDIKHNEFVVVIGGQYYLNHRNSYIRKTFRENLKPALLERVKTNRAEIIETKKEYENTSSQVDGLIAEYDNLTQQMLDLQKKATDKIEAYNEKAEKALMEAQLAYSQGDILTAEAILADLKSQKVILESMLTANKGVISGLQHKREKIKEQIDAKLESYHTAKMFYEGEAQLILTQYKQWLETEDPMLKLTLGVQITALAKLKKYSPKDLTIYLHNRANEMLQNRTGKAIIKVNEDQSIKVVGDFYEGVYLLSLIEDPATFNAQKQTEIKRAKKVLELRDKVLATKIKLGKAKKDSTKYKALIKELVSYMERLVVYYEAAQYDPSFITSYKMQIAHLKGTKIEIKSEDKAFYDFPIMNISTDNSTQVDTLKTNILNAYLQLNVLFDKYIEAKTEAERNKIAEEIDFHLQVIEDNASNLLAAGFEKKILILWVNREAKAGIENINYDHWNEYIGEQVKITVDLRTLQKLSETSSTGEALEIVGNATQEKVVKRRILKRGCHPDAGMSGMPPSGCFIREVSPTTEVVLPEERPSSPQDKVYEPIPGPKIDLKR